MKIIETNQLKVSLHKVKAHSKNADNDKADILAKAGHTSPHLIEINRLYLPTNIHMVWDQYNDNIAIDHNIRHIAHNIKHCQKFNAWLDYKTNLTLKTASYNRIIDWPLTEKFYHFNLDDHATSHKLTKFRAWQRKAINNLIPTMDILCLRYPKLFNDTNKCWTCGLHEETNDMLWLYPIHIEILRLHIVQYTQDLLVYIRQTCDYSDLFLSQEINDNLIFKYFLSPGGTIPPPNTEHPFYLTCRQVITNDFSSIFRGKYKNKKTLHNTILNKFYEFTQLIKRVIWKPHNNNFKKWKDAQHVTKHTYKKY
ncbi:ribonuclease H-like domain-containing protein [Rhizophagus clarus]|nr:ribonuclease H-like domain-containing protein [Rhizophagus clarus]